MTVSNRSPRRQMLALASALSRRVPGRRSSKASRDLNGDGYRVYLIHTVTGQVGPILDPVSGTWEIPLNGIESVHVKVRKQDLAGIERKWYTPWWGGILLTYRRSGVETPLVAGPIKAWPGEDAESLDLEAAGLREIYTHLVIGTNLSAKDVSLGAIMWQLARQAQIKPGGGLPIYEATPDPMGRGHERSYEAFNLSNNGLDKRMKELSEVIAGPDVMFVPAWADDAHRFIRWGVWHGTSASPRIQTGRLHDLDTTAPRSAVATIKVTTSAKELVSRVWATGAGEGDGTVISRAEDFSLLSHGFPFMESVVSDTSATADASKSGGKDAKAEALKAAKLDQMAAGELDARIDAVDQITVSTRADHARLGVDRLRVGDAADVTLAGWLSIPDGTHRTAIIKLGGSLGSEVTVDFQTDSWT